MTGLAVVSPTLLLDEPSGAGSHRHRAATAPAWLFALSFESIEHGQRFMLAIKRMAKGHSVQPVDLVPIIKDSVVRGRDTVDPPAGRSTPSDVWWTGVVRLIVGGPVGWITHLAAAQSSMQPMPR